MKENPTLKILNERASTRTFTDEPITEEERQTIIEGAFRAPTAGNMMMYSIIDIKDQGIKEVLAKSCDDQPFISRASLVLVFIADYQKWKDLYDYSDVRSLDVPHRSPGKSEMLLACSDALIAAQNTVIAAESLGIGSCYIGDILENGELIAKLLDLPQYTLPISMVVFGRSPVKLEPRKRQSKYVVHENRYNHLTEAQMDEVNENLAALFSPHGFKDGISNYPQALYARKHTSDFMREMDRSVSWWIDRWGKNTTKP